MWVPPRPTRREAIRDFWTLLLTVFVVVAVSKSLDASTRARVAGSRAQSAIHAVQRSRRDSVRISCEEANDRHVTTRKGLKVLVRAVPPTPGETVAQRRNAEHLFNLLVSAIAPRYDCAARVRLLTGSTATLGMRAPFDVALPDR